MGFLDSLKGQAADEPPEEDEGSVSVDPDLIAEPEGPRPGEHYAGPAAFCSDYSLVERPGFYALTDDGKDLRQPLLRLVMLDDAPEDPQDGACHLEVAFPADPPQMSAHSRQPIEPGSIVELEAHAKGTAGVGLS